MPSPVRIVSVAVSVLVLAALPVIALAPVYQYFKVESQAVNLLAVADISNTRAEQSDIVFTVDIPPENLKVVYKGSLNIAPLSSSIEDVETLLASSTQRDEQCIWLVTKNANIGSKTASKVLPYWADPVTRHAKLQLKIGASVGSASSSQSPSGLYLSCADSRPRL